MTLEIRKAREEDNALLAKLNEDVQALHAAALPHFFKQPNVDDPGLADMFIEKLTDTNQFILIAFVDNIPAGYVYAELQIKSETPRHPKKNMVYVHHISVRPKFQKQGIGRALLDEIKVYASQKGIETLALDVWTFNENARTFFKSYGLTTFNEKMSLKL
jgi:ribosomal protein S18 acetylase RimI-like enzyme